MCMYGGSTDPAARNMIQGIKNIIHEGIGKRSIHDVCEDIHEYYEREIRHHVDDQKEWTVESIKKHILETNPAFDLLKASSPNVFFNSCIILVFKLLVDTKGPKELTYTILIPNLTSLKNNFIP